MSFSPLPIARPPGTGYSLTSGSTNPTASAHPVLPSSMPTFIVGTQEPCFPLPVSPKVLTCSPSPARDSRYAPHESFFAHASPRNPKIRIETGRKCYRLIMALPGYECNSIVVSTRRKQILHIVADLWESGGGHLERRVSFGYDADLNQARANFDGDYLLVTVPRINTPTISML